MQGVAAGGVIAQLLKRQTKKDDVGYHLTDLNVSYNKLENKGAGLIFEALLDPACHLHVLNMTKTSITMTEGVVVVSSTSNTTDVKVRTRLEELILDKNQMRPLSIARLATLVGLSRNLKTLSLKTCGIDDVCF